MKTCNHYTGYVGACTIAKNYDAVLSLGRNLAECHIKPGTRHLFIDVDDINQSQLQEIFFSAQKRKIPNEEHVRQIIEFVRSLQPTDKLLIHCSAGISRSTAACIIAICERDKKPFHKGVSEMKASRRSNIYNPFPNDIILNLYQGIKE